MKGATAPKPTRTTNATPVTVLKTSASITPQPRVTTLKSPQSITVNRTPSTAALRKPAATPLEPLAFKRPDLTGSPAEKPQSTPVDKPVQKSVRKPVEKHDDNSRFASVLLDRETETTKPIKKYAIAKRKVWAGLAFAGFSLAATGFLVYLNLPDISVRVRASELGISASLPAFRPDGFSVQGIAEVHGDTLTVNFASPDDSFVFTARRSSFDPYQVADHARSIMPGAESVFGGGLTIFVDGSDAIWANGGILYTITGADTLTSQQIIKIAISTD